MTKPTGRPKGAPRKYESDDEKPLTFTLRVPRDLGTILKRYARTHRQSLTEVLMDGLRWRLSEGDPYGERLTLPPAAPDAEKPYCENTDEGTMLVREVRALRAMLTAAVAAGALAAPAPQSRPMGRQERAPAAGEPSEPPAPSAGATRQCRKQHPPYPASRRECPVCVAVRQARVRQRAKDGSAV